MKIIFFGSSEFSIPALKACMETPRQLLLAVTTPPKKQGRGLLEVPTPIERFCREQKIPFKAPPALKNPELLGEVSALKPDLLVVSSYGKMIPAAWLKIPSRLCLNVHPSLLPKYRGAAPLHWPILNGDPETGLSIAEVTDKLDAGDTFFQEKFKIDDQTTSLDLEKILSGESFAALKTVFAQIENGSLQRTVQDESCSSYAAKLKKEDGLMDWKRPANQLANQIRGLLPWPTAYTVFRSEPLQIRKSRVHELRGSQGKPGEILAFVKSLGVVIQTGEGLLCAERVKPAGKKEMSAMDFINGQRLHLGFCFGT